MATPNDVRRWVDTPLDEPAKVDLANLTRQIETLAGMVLWAVRDADLLKPAKLELEDYGHSLGGGIYWFDREVNFAVPKAPVPRALVTYQQLGPNSVGGVRTLIVQQADTEGRFHFDIMRNRLSNTIKAYEIDPWGEIVSAPDMGPEGDETYPMEHAWGWWENEMLQVLFKCRALSLFEIVDSRYLSVLDHVKVLDERDGEPQSWGADYVENQRDEEGKVTLAAVVYAKPHTRAKVLMSTSLFGVRYLLSNAPEPWLEHPVQPQDIDEDVLGQAHGRGYEVDRGRILRPSYAAARDMWILDDIRIKQLARYGIHNQKFAHLHEEARVALQQGRVHLEKQEYSRFKAATRKAWGTGGEGIPGRKGNSRRHRLRSDLLLCAPVAVFLLLRAPLFRVCRCASTGRGSSRVLCRHFPDHAVHPSRLQVEHLSLYHLPGLCHFRDRQHRPVPDSRALHPRRGQPQAGPRQGSTKPISDA